MAKPTRYRPCPGPTPAGHCPHGELIPTTTQYCTACTLTRDHTRGTRQQRGYDRTHEVERQHLLPLAYGQPCPHCGVRMWPHDALHLDHTDDRKTYIGIVHAACNLSAAGRASHRT